MEIEIDPNQEEHQDDKVNLQSTFSNEFYSEKCVKEDTDKSDNIL